MSLDEHAERLQSYSHVSDVEPITKHSSITSIDFKIFPLDRRPKTSNFVFGRWGADFKGGLIRLPRVSKREADESEIKEYLHSFIPSYLVSDVEIRLEPEIDLDDSYYYLHIETPDSDIEGTYVLIDNLSEYDPDKFE